MFLRLRFIIGTLSYLILTGRAEALLIAAYGKGLKVMPETPKVLEDLTPLKPESVEDRIGITDAQEILILQGS